VGMNPGFKEALFYKEGIQFIAVEDLSGEVYLGTKEGLFLFSADITDYQYFTTGASVASVSFLYNK